MILFQDPWLVLGIHSTSCTYAHSCNGGNIAVILTVSMTAMFSGDLADRVPATDFQPVDRSEGCNLAGLHGGQAGVYAIYAPHG